MRVIGKGSTVLARRSKRSPGYNHADRQTNYGTYRVADGRSKNTLRVNVVLASATGQEDTQCQDTNHNRHERDEVIQRTRRRQAHFAELPSKVPPVIATRAGAPHTAMAPPASRAVLFSKVPPSIEISDAMFPLQYSFFGRTESYAGDTSCVNPRSK